MVFPAEYGQIRVEKMFSDRPHDKEKTSRERLHDNWTKHSQSKN